MARHRWLLAVGMCLLVAFGTSAFAAPVDEFENCQTAGGASFKECCEYHGGTYTKTTKGVEVCTFPIDPGVAVLHRGLDIHGIYIQSPLAIYFNLERFHRHFEVREFFIPSPV